MRRGVVRNRTGQRIVARCAIKTLLLSGWLMGCELSPPAGSYDAQTLDIRLDTPESNLDGGGGVEVDASVPTFLGGGAGGSMPGAAGMAGGQAGMAGGQAGAAGGSEGGAGGSLGGVGGAAGGMTGGNDTPELVRLRKLAGYYYMRMDMRSTVSARSVITIRTRNRVSHLLVTRLGVDEDTGQLVGLEQLCHQTFEIVCEQGCSDPKSSMRPEVKNELVNVRPTRSYQVTEAGSSLAIAGQQQTLYLGFDARTNTTLPTSNSDPRVWLNGSANNVREGMWLYLETKPDSILVGQIRCDVYTAQSFVSKFDGTLGGSLDEPSLAGIQASLNTAGSDGATIGTTDNACADDPSNPATTTTVSETVRFAPANVSAEQEAAFWNCPDVSAWDGPMPPPAP
jgi:hypothetical protein